MPAHSTGSLRPLSLQPDGEDALAINWSDGHRARYTWKHLRASCPCAGCRGEHGRPPDPFHILTPQELAPRPPLRPVAIAPVGHYAYKITWNDGHDAGLFTLEHLRSLCQCPDCANAAQSTHQPSAHSETPGH
jgi:DUF971 family protein